MNFNAVYATDRVEGNVFLDCLCLFYVFSKLCSLKYKSKILYIIISQIFLLKYSITFFVLSNFQQESLVLIWESKKKVT